MSHGVGTEASHAQGGNAEDREVRRLLSEPTRNY
jgi:hypothetical protein